MAMRSLEGKFQVLREVAQLHIEYFVYQLLAKFAIEWGRIMIFNSRLLE